ncbi:MAG: hypothetical protein ACHQYP_12720, partial [Nitrospiria bacterium]
MNDEEKAVIEQTYVNLQLAAILQNYDHLQLGPYPHGQSELADIFSEIRSLAKVEHTSIPYSFLNQGVLLTSLYGLLIY